MSRRKSQFSTEYKIMLGLLVRLREDSGRTQIDVAKSMGRTQSIVSKSELGARRLDFVEVRQYCQGIGMDLGRFTELFEEALALKLTPTKRKAKAN